MKLRANKCGSSEEIARYQAVCAQFTERTLPRNEELLITPHRYLELLITEQWAIANAPQPD